MDQFAPAISLPTSARLGDRMLADYFRHEAETLAARCLSDVSSLEDWTSRRGEYRRQLAEMLGLDPLPERTDLRPVVTGATVGPDFRAERLHFQSLPGLYVTGNLYLPREQDQPLPGILYVCGHGSTRINGVAYGSKHPYHHHGVWLARNGYVCLVLDTLQLGEIEGLHHGVFREGRWRWYSQGYTPAGVEAWNGVRALDYLQSRPEVNGTRLGVTGRSGGGATSWWVAALDDRIGAAVPVAGITDLLDHVPGNCIEDHCDCMFPVNLYRWDFPLVAALVAPRPLLIANTDKDPLFPLEGVLRIHEKVRRIYRLYGAERNLGLLITEGGHEDTQDLQVPALRWMDRHLKGEASRPIESAALPCLEPQDLKVFDALPADERNATIDESFLPPFVEPEVPATRKAWAEQRDRRMAALREKVFGGWPERGGPLHLSTAFGTQRGDLRFAAFDFDSQNSVRLRLYLAHRVGLAEPERAALYLLDDDGWTRWLSGMAAAFADELWEEAPAEPDPQRFAALQERLCFTDDLMAWFAPRGVGLSAWTTEPQKRVHIRRRFMLLGQTLAGMQAWDVRRAIQALRSLPEMKKAPPLALVAERETAPVALYAALFEPGVDTVDLREPHATHREGPEFLGVLRVLDMPQAVALAAERSKVVLRETNPEKWRYALETAKKQGWKDRLEVRDTEV